ncbi:MAG: hypothetical protein EBS34_10530, partial [Flavobacteriales bacterium]|nr:hypothetical protein [Flavobacteriales bacterium]
MAFAQPTFEEIENNANSGSELLAIYIDNSYSMSAKGSEGELLSEAKETAKRLIEKTPVNTLIFVCSNNLDATEQRLRTKAEAFDYLEKLSYCPLARSMDNVINWQKNFISKENSEQTKIGKVTQVILSDFQKNTTTFKNKIVANNTFHLVKFTPQNSSNITIDSVWFENPIHKPGFQNEIFVRVQNLSNDDALNTELTLSLNGVLRSSFIDIPKNNNFTTSFKLTETTTGKKIGKFSINDKQIFWDDDYYFSYEVNTSASVLILNSENASAATNKAYEVEPFFTTKSISEQSFSKSSLENVDLLVFNGVNNPSLGLISDAKEFINNGGSVLVIPGKNVDFPSLNKLLTELNLPNFGSKSSNASRIQTVEFKDPFFAGIFEKENPNISMPSVANYYTIPNLTNAKSILTLRNNEALFIKNNKKAYLFTTALQDDFSSVASNAIFPTILLRIGELSVRSLPLYATIGIDNAILLPLKKNTEKAIRLKSKEGDFIPAQQKRTSQVLFSLTGPEATEKLKSGNYEVIGEELVGNLALNYDRKESNAVSKNKDEIISTFNDAG